MSDMLVMPVGDHVPLGYHPANSTLDDGIQAFKRSQLLVRFEAPRQAKEAVTDLLLIRAHKKEEVPDGFKKLPYVNVPFLKYLYVSMACREMNGLHICFKTVTLHSQQPSSSSGVYTYVCTLHVCMYITNVLLVSTINVLNIL